MAQTTLEVPQGTFTLQRGASGADSSLRAWDAADEYLLHHLHDVSVPAEGIAALTVNDAFGALTIALATSALAESGPTMWSDSATALAALAHNAAVNDVSEPATLVGVDSPQGPLGLVVVKVPKTNGLLEDQLHRLRPALGPETVVVAAGMVKHVHTSTIELFESIIGPTHTSLARKKARLIHASVDPELRPGLNPWPVRWAHGPLTVVNHGGVFSARQLDIGTRFFLEHLPALGGEVIDLGCGNGVVGASVAANGGCRVTFVDESYAAVASAEATMAASLPEASAEFRVATRPLEAIEAGSVDAVVCNPPFHQDQALSANVARQMFADSRRVLREGGELWVVGNRHLGYHKHLKRRFGNGETVAANPKFVVLRATAR